MTKEQEEKIRTLAKQDTGFGELYRECLTEIDELRAACRGRTISCICGGKNDSRRMEWFFGKDSVKSQNFIMDYLRGAREDWTVDQWRQLIDKEMGL